LNYTGYLNLPAQQIDIETHAADPQGSPVNGKFLASGYLSSPQWQASLHLHDLPARSALLPRLGAGIGHRHAIASRRNVPAIGSDAARHAGYAPARIPATTRSPSDRTAATG